MHRIHSISMHSPEWIASTAIMQALDRTGRKHSISMGLLHMHACAVPVHKLNCTACIRSTDKTTQPEWPGAPDGWTPLPPFVPGPRPLSTLMDMHMHSTHSSEPAYS